MVDSPADVLKISHDMFGWASLRPGQAKAIESVIAGHDTLVVMPTGAGKSAIYQIAGAFLGGTTVVVSPLIALQIDQLNSLAEHPSAPRAVAINSSQGQKENREALAALEANLPLYFFVSPEQLAKPEVARRLISSGVGLFVVDEAHLVSQWGHDFRPDYLRLGEVIDKLGHPRVLALTATGSPPVRQEIRQRLGFQNEKVLTLGFDRPNLHLDVVRHEDEQMKRKAVLARPAVLDGPGLIYVPTHRDADTYSAELTSAGIRAEPYHAGHTVKQRRQTQESFMAGKIDVVVATTAFGLGIDKANVRYVLHTSPSDSLDSYYQEIGRAGRDGLRADVELHYRPADLGLRAFFAHRSSHPAELDRLFTRLVGASAPITVVELADELVESAQSVTRQVNLLREAGAVSIGERGVSAADMSAPQAVSSAQMAEHERSTIDSSRLSMMREYAETRQCRRQHLLAYFGENLPEPCGNCDTCERGTAFEFEPEASVEDELAAGRAVRHALWGKGSIVHSEATTLTVYFETAGYRVLSRPDVLKHHLLELS